MKKVLTRVWAGVTALVLSLASTVAMAQKEINVLQAFPPGGMTEKINLAVKRDLEKAGYKVNFIRFDNCKGVESWVSSNPKEPMVFEYFLAGQVLKLIDPTNPSGCDIKLTKDSVLTTVYSSSMQMCSFLPKDQAVALLRSGEAKIGVQGQGSSHPVVVRAENMVKEINPKAKIISYRSNPALVQGLVSKEIDMTAQASAATIAISAGATCFLTSGPKEKAAQHNQVSITEFGSNLKSAGPWGMSVIVGLNVDTKQVRDIVVGTVKTDPELAKHFASGADKAGIPAGRTPEQQLVEVEQFLKFASGK
jgi:tripartite-type tricarboxylate transporter receptor subunit TctC